MKADTADEGVSAEQSDSRSGEPGWRCVTGFGRGGACFLEPGLGGLGSVGLKVVPDFTRHRGGPKFSALGTDVGRRTKLDAGIGNVLPQVVLCVVWLEPKTFAGFDSAVKGLGTGAEGAFVEVGHGKRVTANPEFEKLAQTPRMQRDFEMRHEFREFTLTTDQRR